VKIKVKSSMFIKFHFGLAMTADNPPGYNASKRKEKPE